MVTLLRIDDRLIHGQVALLWVNLTQADTIIVANDNYANNAMLTMSLKLAKPSGVDLYVFTMEKAIEYLSSENDTQRIFVVVNSTEDALVLSNNCKEIQAINIGGIRSSINKKQISMQVFLDAKDIENIKQIYELNKNIYLQAKPDEKKVSYSGIISLWEK